MIDLFFSLTLVNVLERIMDLHVHIFSKTSLLETNPRNEKIEGAHQGWLHEFGASIITQGSGLRKAHA